MVVEKGGKLEEGGEAGFSLMFMHATLISLEDERWLNFWPLREIESACDTLDDGSHWKRITYTPCVALAVVFPNLLTLRISQTLVQKLFHILFLFVFFPKGLRKKPKATTKHAKCNLYKIIRRRQQQLSVKAKNATRKRVNYATNNKLLAYGNTQENLRKNRANNRLWN